jgi:leader peptidase (prepilin peptidase)/N-methyltransferase
VILWLANKLLVQGGHKPIGFRGWYLLADLAAIVLVIAGFMNWGMTFRGAAFALMTIHAAVTIFTDFSRHIIPDRLTLAAGIIGMMAAIILPGGSILNAVLGGTIGFLLFLGISVAGQAVFKKEAMGGGDIKMAAVIGTLAGWQGVLFSLFGGAVLALAFVGVSSIVSHSRYSKRVPFGPFLAIAAIVYLSIIDYLIETIGLLWQ